MLNIEALTRETLAKASADLLKSMNDGSLKKTINVATGLLGVNLQAPAHQLVPLMSPFRESITRRVKPGSNSDQWRNITGISSPKLSVAESAAAAQPVTTVASKTAGYKISGIGDEVTREAIAASQGFDPALSKATTNALLKAMQLEEQYFLGGNITALSTPGAPTVTEIESIAGATIGASAHFVRIAALTLPAMNRLTIQRPAKFAAGDAVLDGVATAAVDPAADGVTVVGAEGTVTTTGANNSLRISWTAVPGAAGYAVFVGTTTGAANLKCEAIVTQTLITLRSLAATGQAGSALTGTSADALTYDGIIAQLVAAGSGAYTKNVGGLLTGATADGEVVEIQEAFSAIYDAAKVGSFRVVLGGQEGRSVSARGNASNSTNIVLDPSSAGRVNMTIGIRVSEIINATTGDVCSVETAPWMPGGSILILPKVIPYADANISAPFEFVCGYDWERIDYAVAKANGPVYPFEIRNWGVLEGLFTGGCGYLFNIYRG